MKIAILSIGDEVVMGKTVNTNASYIAKELQNKHFVVSSHLTVRDTYDEILNGFDFLFKNSDCIITTGGLGPTVDDLTKEAVGLFYNEEFVLNESELEKIRVYFSKMNKDMPKSNEKQACFLKNSTIIKNDNGTAPGMLVERNNKIVINLPGPHKEMEPMLHDFVIPYLVNKFAQDIIEKKYRLMNIGESHAEELLKPLYEKFKNIKIAPYASVGVVDYIISTNNKEESDHIIKAAKIFEDIMADYIVGDCSKEINKIIVDLLTDKKLTIACAESCTGGMISSYLVDVPGSSIVFLEGMVTYSNEAKISRLGVKEETLDKFGAVSEETAFEMAKGIVLKSGANIGIVTTGIAGPGGGTDEKPVGLVYTAICYKDKVLVFKNIYNGDRYKIRLRTNMGLLYNLFKFIKTL
ncbi:MAG: damage-inducible protein CinA [Haloplasmataceae bacterium]|jgi:nicotinamide-nucleotide amidase|nr:damage-inducible protein CinA [Haloplasmataceae bacterium]